MKIFTINDDFMFQKHIDEIIQRNGGLLKADFNLNNPVIITGHSPLINDIVRKIKKIHIYHLPHLFGPIIHFPGDLSLLLLSYGPSNFGEKCINAIKKYLAPISNKIEVNNNDLMLDNKKVGSWCQSNDISGWYQTAVHFSINTDIDLIKQICIKPTDKKPGALKDYNITGEMIWNELVSQGIIEVEENA